MWLRHLAANEAERLRLRVHLYATTPSCRRDRADTCPPTALGFAYACLFAVSNTVDSVNKCAQSTLAALSKSWCGRFDGGKEIGCGFDFEFALINLVAARDEKRIEVWPADDQTRSPAAGCWNDAVDTSGLIADLDTQTRGDIKPSVGIDFHAAGAAGLRKVGHMQMVIALLMLQRAIGLNLVGIYPMTARIVDIKQRLVGRSRDAVNPAQSGIHNFPFSFGRKVPDAAGSRIVGTRTCHVH